MSFHVQTKDATGEWRTVSTSADPLALDNPPRSCVYDDRGRAERVARRVAVGLPVKAIARVFDTRERSVCVAYARQDTAGNLWADPIRPVSPESAR